MDLARAKKIIKPNILTQKDEFGLSWVHWAILDNNLPLLQYLVKHGATIDVLCLRIAKNRGYNHIIDYLSSG